MKKKFLIPVLILGTILLILTTMPNQDSSDRVTFYYARQDFDYIQQNGAIAPEVREVGRRSQDLPYLLALYLEGPMDPNLQVPFPGKNIDQVQTLILENGVVNISLGELGADMGEGEFTLACACLSKTCLELSDAKRVKITSGDRTRIMDRDNVLLFDESTWAELPQTEETK